MLTAKKNWQFSLAYVGNTPVRSILVRSGRARAYGHKWLKNLQAIELQTFSSGCGSNISYLQRFTCLEVERG